MSVLASYRSGRATGLINDKTERWVIGHGVPFSVTVNARIRTNCR
jgi:hypothetical protein